MRRCLPLLACSVFALTLTGCAGTPFANLFTFTHKSGGNVGASDALGARMMTAQNKPAKSTGKAAPKSAEPATATAAVPE
ncbi:MAG: hypothetical protein HBSAPP03_26840 [Phycisphaerae bacterium]|nr:MAG: hypothetical protein HBSAPP03_26840 [Phycisphaerae bacterium]